MKYWVFSLLLLMHLNAWCLTETTVKKAGEIEFQIIQSGLTIDHNSIKKASLVNLANGNVGVSIELKPTEADVLKQLTYENIGRDVMIVYNDHVLGKVTIQTTLGNKILIMGFTRPEANLFLQTLNLEEKKQKRGRFKRTLLDTINDNNPAIIQPGRLVQGQ